MLKDSKKEEPGIGHKAMEVRLPELEAERERYSNKNVLCFPEQVGLKWNLRRIQISMYQVWQ